MSLLRKLSLGLVMLAAVASAQPVSDVTEDGLVRVPSSRKAGVYRLPDATFAQYRRVMLLPSTVAFRKNWDRKGLDRLDTGLKPSEREKIANDLVEAFHEEMIAELVQRGGFELTDTPAKDVLLIAPAITELEITAPDAGSTPGARTYVRNAGSMTLVVEMRDAASGVTVGRVIDYEPGRETRELLLVNHIAEARIAFANAARYTRSAINIAKTERDETLTN
ncbi:MAG TPA: DUF3313 family protein [Steroidobacteraceae bacterium]|jgi:hypothetical protein|nr:DUF3313 family protein [Steroidobacteraceae bacterium]